MSKYRIKINGKTYEMEIERVDETSGNKSSGAQTTPHAIHEKSSVSAPVRHAGGPKADNSAGDRVNVVLSPMPGSVIKVLAEDGDSVAAGQPVLVLEAMKMENEICAPKSGKIKTVFVTAGQTVSGNAALFEMEPED